MPLKKNVIENRISSNEVNCDMMSTSQNQIFEENITD